MENVPKEVSVHLHLLVSQLSYIVLPFFRYHYFGSSSLKTSGILTFNGSCTLTVYTDTPIQFFKQKVHC